MSTIKRDVADRKLKATWHNGGRYVVAADWASYLEACRTGNFDLAPEEDFATRISPALAVDARTPLYNGPAVYLLFNDSELVYIGHTKTLLERLAQHCKSKKFDSFSFIRCDAAETYRIEQWAIRKYRPKLNLR